jgi:VIT1/CCC1 family predicted Fe2+/Mn2+ transporter
MLASLAFWRTGDPPSGDERHARSHLLSDFILGSQDGIVNVLAVLLGVAAGAMQQSGSAGVVFRIVLAGGLAATFGESISMGAVAYTSTLARRDHYRGELAREEQEMREDPEKERQEVSEVFRRWGFEGPELEAAVGHIISRPRAWLEFMMAHELGLAPLEENQARKSALLVGFAAVFGSLIPLIPFIVFSGDTVLGMIGSVVVAAIVLFAIGWYKGRITVGRPYRSGAQMLVIGIVSAVAGFLIAYAVGASR